MANVGSGASGKTLIGAGNGASPTFANIGTNSGLTAHGILIAEGNGAFAATATGSSGQVLQSGGAGADPSYSTATFPGTAGSVGVILRSDGTNWVATTATYPTTTTLNQILYSPTVNTISGLSTVNSAILNTNGSGVPSLATSPSCSGTLTAGTGLTATTGNVTISSGNLTLPTSSSSVGQVQINGHRWIHDGGKEFSVFIGEDAGNFTVSGDGNVAVGPRSQGGLTSGTQNVALGNNAQTGLTSGNNNIAIGHLAQDNGVLTGDDNIAIGQASQDGIAGGTTRCIAIGRDTQRVVTGNENVSIGYQAHYNLTSGVDNVCVGSHDSTGGGVSGNGNVLIGAYTGRNYTGSEANNVLIGLNEYGTAAESNVTRINTANATTCFIGGITGVTPSNIQPVGINSSTKQLGVIPTVASNTGNSAAPAATASTAAYVMMGLGSSWKLTPTTFTSVRISINGQMTNDTTADGINIIMAFGTGTAPIAGAAVTGTAVGINTIWTALTGLLTNGAPFSKTYIVTGLSAGTAYWFDLQFKAVTGGNAKCLNLEFTAQELVS